MDLGSLKLALIDLPGFYHSRQSTERQQFATQVMFVQLDSLPLLQALRYTASQVVKPR